MDEFIITCFSNSNTNTYNNTLTRFENDLPKNFHLPLSENWNVCLQSVGFSTDFRNMLLPKSKFLSNILILKETVNTKTPLVDEYNMIINPDKWLKGLEKLISIKFPNQYISVTDMKSKFDEVKKLGIKLEFRVEEDYTFRITPTFDSLEDASHDVYYLIFHENTYESLGLNLYYGDDENPTKIAKKCIINNELHYVYQIKYDHETIESLSDNWKIQYPDLIKIKCDQIQDQILNDTLSQDIAILKIKFNPDKKYHIQEFDNEHYVPLANTTLNKISISLTDNYNRQLNLKRGVSSFVRLKFKRMSENFFNVRAYSDFKNSNNFTFNIPQQLYMDSNWKVALTSLHYSNKFKPLPYEESLRTIFTAKVTENKIGTLNKFILPNLMFTSVYELITLINQYVKSIDGNLTMMGENNQINSELKPTFFLKHGTVIFLHPLIAEILGYEYEEENESIILRGNILAIFAKEMDAEVEVVNIVSDDINKTYYENPYYNPRYYQRFIFQGSPDINALKPLYFMVYCDIISPCIVGSNYANLLKIIPLENDGIDKIQEFKHKEYHSMDSTLLKKININIRSNDGNLVNFAENTKIYLNLLFIRK